MATLNTADTLQTSFTAVNVGTNPLQVESQLCTYLAQKLDASAVSGTHLSFGRDLIVNNLAVDTPNFIIESKFSQDVSNVDVINYLIGSNTFSGSSNSINKQVTIDPSSRALIAETLQFDTSVNRGPFSSVGGTPNSWTAQFATDASLVLSLAINTQFNNLTTGKSLLTTQEDVSFNTTNALANFDNTFSNYFVKTSDTSGNTIITVSTIPSANQLSTNDTIIDICDQTLAGNIGNFGIYALSSDPAAINVEASKDAIVVGSTSDFPLVTTLSGETLPTSLTQTQFSQLFSSDLSYVFPDNWFFQIKVDESYSGGGYYPQYPSESTTGNYPFTIDNTQIVDNVAYMAAGVQNEPDQKITTIQTPLTIDVSNGSNASNASLMGLTASGETLDISQYNVDGGIKIVGLSDAGNGRVTEEVPSDVYDNYHVDYTLLPEPLKTVQGVGYIVSNTVIPTGNGQYANDITTGVSFDASGSTLYVAGDPSGAMSFTSDIANRLPSNYATYFTISESDNLTSENDALYYASLTTDYSNAYYPFDASNIVPDVKINVTLTGLDVSTNLTSTYYREHFISKQISDLSFAQSDANWNLLQGISGDALWLTSQIKDVTSIFPSQSDIKTILDVNNISPITQDVTITYSSEVAPQDSSSGLIISSSYLYDQVRISWTDLSGSNTNHLIIKENDSLGNTNITFTDITNVSTTDTLVSITGTNTKGQNASVYGGVAHKVTIVDDYHSRFQLPLSGFQNLYYKTPLLRSTLIYYYVEDSNGKQYTSSAYLSGFTDSLDNSLHASEEVVLASGGQAVNTITLGKSAITCLLGNIQGIMDPSAGDWIDEAPYVDVDPYFSTESKNELYGYPVSDLRTEINPTEYKSKMNLSAYSYQSRLNANVPTNFVVNGYGYDSTLISSFAGLSPPFTPDFADATGIIPVAPSPSTSIPVTLDVSSNFSLNGLPTLQLTLYTDASKNQQYATIRTNRSTYISNMTIFHVPKPVFHVEHYLDASLIYAIDDQGDDASFNPVGPISSGNLSVDTGVTLTYTDVSPGDAVTFSLNSDTIAVRVVGDATGVTPQTITDLTFQTVNGTTNTPSTYSSGPDATETLIIPYYRGYDYTGSLTQLYIINRSGNVASSSFVSGANTADLGDMYVGANPDVSYNTVGNIGALPTFNWSRLPASYLTADTLNVPIFVYGDSVKITDASGMEINTTLLEYPLYNFVTSDYLTAIVPNRVALNYLDLSGTGNVFWRVTNAKGQYTLKYNTNPFINPETATFTNIAAITNTQANAGFLFDSSGSDPNGPFSLQTSESTPISSTSYFVVAPPQMKFTQANTDSAQNVPFDMSNSLQYNPNAFITRIVRVSLPNVNVYTPFNGVSKTNNVTFTQVNGKSFPSYVTSPDSTQYTYNITGSSVNIQEFPAGSVVSTTVYNGLISDLSSNSTLDVSLNTTTGVYRVKFAQDLASIGLPNTNKNIIFTIGNQTLPNVVDNLDLDVIGSQINLIGVKPVILNDSSANIDASHNNFGLQLYKYVCPIVDFYDLSNILTTVKLSPTTRYYANVDVPLVDFSSVPYNLSTQLGLITSSDIQEYNSSTGEIDWVQDTSFNSGNPFNFDLVALDLSGKSQLINVLGVDATTISKFTYITTPDIMNIVSGEGSSLFRIDANGQVYANTMSSSIMKLFTSTAFSSSEPSVANGCNNEFVAYNVNTFNV